MPGRSESLKEAVEILAASRLLTVSTGAGMSKESGIPTFRDAPNALWENFSPEQLATRAGFAEDPALVWRWYAERREMIAAAVPNAGHRAIADLESLLDDVTVITQNIDNLHRRAGSTNIVEIHGNIFRFKCFDQNHPVDSVPENNGVPPTCHCGSFIRPDVVWFGEMLPDDAIENAYRVLAACDAILVVGTSGTVFPAASFPDVARQSGARIVEINPEETAVTPEADVFLRGAAGKILPELVLSLKTQSDRGTNS